VTTGKDENAPPRKCRKAIARGFDSSHCSPWEFGQLNSFDSLVGCDGTNAVGQPNSGVQHKCGEGEAILPFRRSSTNQKKHMQICVRGLAGKTITVKALHTDSVADLKAAIALETCGSKKGFRLSCARFSWMEDVRMLSDLNLRNGSTVDVNGSLFGGAAQYRYAVRYQASSQNNNSYGSGSNYSNGRTDPPPARRMNFEIDRTLDARKCRSDTLRSSDENADFVRALTGHKNLGTSLFKERVCPVRLATGPNMTRSLRNQKRLQRLLTLDCEDYVINAIETSLRDVYDEFGVRVISVAEHLKDAEQERRLEEKNKKPVDDLDSDEDFRARNVDGNMDGYRAGDHRRQAPHFHGRHRRAESPLHQRDHRGRAGLYSMVTILNKFIITASHLPSHLVSTGHRRVVMPWILHVLTLRNLKVPTDIEDLVGVHPSVPTGHQFAEHTQYQALLICISIHLRQAILLQSEKPEQVMCRVQGGCSTSMLLLLLVALPLRVECEFLRY